MSWLFGKKKHTKDSPPSTPTNSHSSDEYIFVEKKADVSPQKPSDTEVQSGSNDIYPSLRGNMPYPPSGPASDPPKQAHQTDFQNVLKGVPFKLCHDLERNLNNDSDIDKLRIDEVSYLIEQIEKSNNDYDFSLENSIIAEMESQTDE